MKVSTFGYLRVDDGDIRLGPKDLGGVKPKQILEILILARGHFVSTAHLTEHLWPGSMPRNAVATINTYVSVLRSKMFTDRDLARRTIVTEPRGYRLEVGNLDVDLEQVDALLLNSDRASRSDRIRYLSDAVSFVTGDLLEDAPYDAWVLEDRALYRDRATRAYNVLSREWLAEREVVAAHRCAESALKLSPYSEESLRLAMLSNYALGYPDIARRVYHDARRRLAADLGVEPTSDTVKFVWAIDAGISPAEMISQLSRPYDSPAATMA